CYRDWSSDVCSSDLGAFKPVSVVRHMVPAGTAAIVATAGGGGWGNPLHRELDRVRQDVLEGYVSIESAARDYGVIIDSQTLEVRSEERRVGKECGLE